MRATPCSSMHSSAVSPPGWCSDAARPLRWLHRDAMCQEPAIVRQRRAVRPRKPRCGHVVSMHFHAGARTLDERFCRAAALGSMWGWAGDCACDDVVGRPTGWWAMGDGVEGCFGYWWAGKPYWQRICKIILTCISSHALAKCQMRWSRLTGLERGGTLCLDV